MKTATFNTEATEGLKRGTIVGLWHGERTRQVVSEQLYVLCAEFFSVLSVCNASPTRCRFLVRNGDKFATTHHCAPLQSGQEIHG